MTNQKLAHVGKKPSCTVCRDASSACAMQASESAGFGCFTVDLGAYILIKKIASSLAPEAIPDPLHQLGHLMSILLLQPLLVQLGPPGLIPLPVLLLPYQVFLYADIEQSPC